MTTEPTPTPDLPPMPELPEGYTIGGFVEGFVDSVAIIEDYLVCNCAKVCRTDSWEFAALMAFLWEKKANNIWAENGFGYAMALDNSRSWQRIAESRMGG